MRELALLTIALLLAGRAARAETRDVVTNGGFEIEAGTGVQRPPYWYVGWPDGSDNMEAQGRWALDEEVKSAGRFSLRLEPNAAETYNIVQILDTPTHDLEGKTVRVRADVRYDDTTAPPGLIVLAFNPTLPSDPMLGAGAAGKLLVEASGPPGRFQTYEGEFTCTAEAQFMVLVLIANGNQGRVWFDNVVVERELPDPPSPPAAVPAPIERRAFRMGFTNENPANFSERARERLVEQVDELGEVLNVFFHVRWTALTGEDVRRAHREGLQFAQWARENGLRVALTLDFTHDAPETVGELNPRPDGTSVGSLEDAGVRQAYIEELLTLADLVQPEYIIVGIEVSIFHDKHPDQWPALVALHKAAYRTVKEKHPNTHITSYFTLDWMVHPPTGLLNQQHVEAWRQLLPELDSIGYSVYPGTFEMKEDELAEDYFIKAREIAPDLPLILPEFGVAGDPDTPGSLEQQAATLERILRELATVPVELTCWYSLYDQSYLGAVDWFRTAFNRIGIFTQEGARKPVWAVWKAVRGALREE